MNINRPRPNSLCHFRQPGWLGALERLGPRELRLGDQQTVLKKGLIL